MKYFKASGLWFPSHEPENRVAGALRFSESGIRLHLLGGFQGGWSPDVKTYDVIQGVVGDSPYGEFVTLYECFQVTKSMRSQGIGSETIRCNRAYIGNDYFIDEGTRVNSVDITTTYLYEWSRMRGVHALTLGHPASKETVIQFVSLEPMRFDVDEATILVGTAPSSRITTKAASIRATSSLSVTPKGPLGARAITTRFVQRLCDLISFATDRPNAIEEVSLRQPKENGLSNQHRLLYDRIFRVKSEGDSICEHDMLFSLSEAVESGLNIFQRWLDFTRTRGAFCTVYFSNCYSQPKYLDERFQRFMAAFGLLSGSIRQPTQQTNQFVEDVRKAFLAHFSGEDREFLAHLIPSPIQAEMTLVLRTLLEDNSELMSQIIQDFDEFVQAVSNTLRYFETREDLKHRPHLEGPMLLYALQSIRLLIKILVLDELGFGPERSTTFIERNNDFLHLKALLGKT